MNVDDASPVAVSMTSKSLEIVLIFWPKKPFLIKTMLTMFVLCLVLRSAFDYKQSHVLISSEERANSNSILKSVLGNKVYDFVSSKSKKAYSALDGGLR